MEQVIGGGASNTPPQNASAVPSRGHRAPSWRGKNAFRDGASIVTEKSRKALSGVLTPPPPRLVGARVDTLHAAFRVSVAGPLWAALLEAKKTAGKTDGKQVAADVAGVPWAVQSRGSSSGYPLILKNADATVLVRQHDERDETGAVAGPGWSVEIQVRAAFLATRPFRDVIEFCRRIAAAFAEHTTGPAIRAERVRRLDLAVDVEFGEDSGFTTEDRGSFVGRPKKPVDYVPGGENHDTRTHWAKRKEVKLTGFSFALGAAFSARLYDKTEELRRYEPDHEKQQIERSLWTAQGWEGGDVWRLEFQARTEALNEMEIRTLDHAEKQLDSVWSYATSKWLRLVDKASATRGHRASLDARWAPFADAIFSAAHDPISRARMKRGGVSKSQACGTVLSYMASLGSLPEPSGDVGEYLARICADFAALMARDLDASQLGERAHALRARSASIDDRNEQVTLDSVALSLK